MVHDVLFCLMYLSLIEFILDFNGIKKVVMEMRKSFPGVKHFLVNVNAACIKDGVDA